MGTTLTGLTPATTYDALIKVGDNGPLSATAKYLSDGLGNDSILALSSNKVGIGTFAPSQPLHVNGNMRLNGALYDNNNLAGTSGQILSSTGTATNWIDVSSLGVVDGSGTANYVSKWSDSNTLTNSLIFDNGTNVGIGTSSPDSNLVVDGSGSVRVNLKASNTRYGTIYADSGILALASITAIPLVLATNDTERMRITGAGNVGIGTSSPDSKLRIQNDNATVPSLTIRDGGTPTADHIRVSSGTYGDAFFVTAIGNVGIGTSSPQGKLDIASESPFVQFTDTTITSLERNWRVGISDTEEGDFFISQETGDDTNLYSNRFYINRAGNVGIGSTSPAAYSGYRTLEVAATNGGVFRLKNDAESGVYEMTTTSSETYIKNVTATPMWFGTSNAERMRITSAGNVGIGTSSPATKLDVTGDIRSTSGLRIGANADGTTGQFLTDNTNTFLDYKGFLSIRTAAASTEVARFLSTGGLTFNGDTAAANALDDYEEGTWTPTITFGGASTGVTYAAGRAGQYTKIGRQVTATAYILLTSKGSSTGSASIGGLPYTIGGSSGFYSSASFSAISSLSYVGMLQGYGEINTNRIDLVETTEAGSQTNITDADFTNASQVLVHFTYFV